MYAEGTWSDIEKPKVYHCQFYLPKSHTYYYFHNDNTSACGCSIRLLTKHNYVIPNLTEEQRQKSHGLNWQNNVNYYVTD